MYRRCRYRLGFTLLEILISIALLGVGLSAIFSLFPIGIHAAKQTVDGTRAAVLADTARSELMVSQVQIGVTNRGSSYFDGEWCNAPSGSFYYPYDMRYFILPVYEYYDAGGDLVKRVLFDDRRMVPIRLAGTFSGGHTINVSQASLTRDCERLAYFLDTDDVFSPWRVTMRVRGRDYVLDTVNFGAGLSIASLVVDPAGPQLPTYAADAPFDIHLPVAMKEPPMDVAQEWAGGKARFSEPNPYTIDHAADTRKIANCLSEGGWISVRGDWYRVAAFDGDHITLDSSQPLPPAHDTQFDVVLPVADFSQATALANDPADPWDDTLDVPVPSSAGTAAQAAQAAFFESGAQVEVVLDGARGCFDPANAANPDTRTIFDCTQVNPDTAGFIVAGNFIRVEGVDYEIASSYDSVAGAFSIVGPVPALGSDKYFNIVLGYKPALGQVPHVARFPVRQHVRQAGAPGPNGCPIVSFVMGCDTNGNLPQDFIPIGAGALAHPVHVLPANRTQFCYQVAITQRGIVANLDRTSPWVTAPDIASPSPTSPALPSIPYPVLDYVCATFNPIQVSTYRIFVPPAGKDLNPNWMSNYAVKRDIIDTDTDGARLKVHPHPPFSGQDVPFYIWDRNLIGMPMVIGTASYNKPSGRCTFLTMNANAAYLTPGTVILVNYLDDKSKPQTDSFTVDYNFNPTNGWIRWKSGMKSNGTPVTLSVAPSGLIGPPDGNPPHARGTWTHGSNAVKAVYPNQWGSFELGPSTGFPESPDADARCNIEAGDYLEPPDGGNWYTIVAVRHNKDAGRDYILLDRAYTGPTTADFSSRYATPLNKTFSAQVTVFRNYGVQPLRDTVDSLSAAKAAAFGYDAVGNASP